ncbi:MAG: hypothetical protein Q8O72_10715 [Bacteroidales bacterium]|nr:hypothetical protein [Bacteroidales bacterium]
MNRFCEFAKVNVIEGDKVSIDDILNKPIIVTNAKVGPSKYQRNTSGKCLTLQFEQEPNHPQILFTSSEVLISQIEEYNDKIPFEAKIVKINKYYTFR